MTEIILDSNQILVMSLSIIAAFMGLRHGSEFLRDLG